MAARKISSARKKNLEISGRLESALRGVEKWQEKEFVAIEKAMNARSKSARTRFKNQAIAANRNKRSAETRLSNILSRDIPKRTKGFAPTVQQEMDGPPVKFFEVGLDYDSSLDAKRGCEVMVNFHISRIDGKLMHMREARNVVKKLHEGNQVSDIREMGYRINGVNWSNRKGRNSGRYMRQGVIGKPESLNDFSNIFQSVGLNHYRIGGVKE